MNIHNNIGIDKEQMIENLQIKRSNSLYFDNILILAAGFGTRMGEIGKRIPKPLWPIFDMSFLETQLLLLDMMNIKYNKIFVNIHHCKESFLNTNFSKKIEFLYEENLLDVGGAIHNLANLLNYTGTLLIINSDQLFFCNNQTLQALREKITIKNKTTCLLLKEVTKISGLNKLEIDEKSGLILSILSNHVLKSNQPYLTYVGIAAINLNLLIRVNGRSQFFKSIAEFNSENTSYINGHDMFFNDIGDVKKYINFIDLILNKKKQEDYSKEDKIFLDNLSLKIFNKFEFNYLNLNFKTNLYHTLNFSKNDNLSDSKTFFNFYNFIIKNYNIKNKILIVLNLDGFVFCPSLNFSTDKSYIIIYGEMIEEVKL